MDVLRHSMCTGTAWRTLPGGPSLSPIGRNMIGLASHFGSLIVNYMWPVWREGTFSSNRFCITGAKHRWWPLCCASIAAPFPEICSLKYAITCSAIMRNGDKNFIYFRSAKCSAYCPYYNRKMADKLLWLLQRRIRHCHCSFQDLYSHHVAGFVGCSYLTASSY